MRMNIAKALNLANNSISYKIGINTYFGDMFLGSRIDDILLMLDNCKIDIKLSCELRGNKNREDTLKIDPNKIVVKVISKCNEEHTLGFIINSKTGIVYGIYEKSMWIPERLLNNLNKGYGEPKYYTYEKGSKKLHSLELTYTYPKSIYGNTIVYNSNRFSSDITLRGITVLGKDLEGFSEYFEIPEAVFTTKSKPSTEYLKYISGPVLEAYYLDFDYSNIEITEHLLHEISMPVKVDKQKVTEINKESILDYYRRTRNDEVQMEYTLLDAKELNIPPALWKQEGKSIDKIVREFLESRVNQ